MVPVTSAPATLAGKTAIRRMRMPDSTVGMGPEGDAVTSGPRRVRLIVVTGKTGSLFSCSSCHCSTCRQRTETGLSDKAWKHTTGHPAHVGAAGVSRGKRGGWTDRYMSWLIDDQDPRVRSGSRAQPIWHGNASAATTNYRLSPSSGTTSAVCWYHVSMRSFRSASTSAYAGSSITFRSSPGSCDRS